MTSTPLLLRTLAGGALASALLVLPAAPPAAAHESCRGRAATIVGTQGQDVVGTEGSDVIVTGRAHGVRALGGDDIICVTAHRRVDAGPGNDLVDTTRKHGQGVRRRPR